MASHGVSLVGLMGSVVGSVVALQERIVSFTGRFDVSFLQKAHNSAQTVAATPHLTNRARKARERLRWAESLQKMKTKGRRYFSDEEWALIEELASGNLHKAAEDATRKSGYGRIKKQDGSFEDIAPHGGGIVRRVLDNADPNTSGDESVKAIEEDDGVVDWGSPSTPT